MELLAFIEKNFIAFFTIFYRFLLLFFLFPVFGVPYFPTKIKIFLSLILALSLLPVIKIQTLHEPKFYDILMIFFLDFILIFIVCLFFRIILTGIQIGGELVGYQMGFGITQTIDPLTGFGLPVVSQFVYLIFLLVFFSFDFHHYLISFVYYSFEKIPPGSFSLDQNIGIFVIKKSRLMFELGIKFLAPLMVLMMLVYIALAITGRLIPQINILFVSFPLTIGIGLIFFGLMLTLLPRIIKPLFNDYFLTINQILIRS